MINFAPLIQTKCFLILKRTLLHRLNSNYPYQDPIIGMITLQYLQYLLRQRKNRVNLVSFFAAS